MMVVTIVVIYKPLTKKHMDDEDDDNCRPKTIKEAIERFIELWDNEDIEFLTELPKSDMNFICANLERKVIDRCDLSRDNIPLLEECGSKDMPLKEAAYVITRALWKEFN